MSVNILQVSEEFLVLLPLHFLFIGWRLIQPIKGVCTLRFIKARKLLIICYSRPRHIHHTFLPHDAMHSADYAVARCLSVFPSVCLSHAGILSKRLYADL